MTRPVGSERLQISAGNRVSCFPRLPTSHTSFKASLPCISTEPNLPLLPRDPLSSLVDTDHCLLGSASESCLCTTQRPCSISVLDSYP